MMAFYRKRGLTDRLVLVLVLCLTHLWAPAAQQQPPELSKWIERIGSLEQEVLRQPADLRLQVQLAEAQIKIGRLTAAAATLQEALRIKPEHVPALVAFGNLYRRRYQFEEAIKISERIHNLAPQDVPGQVMSAELAEDRMEYSAAEAIYKSILQKNPRDVSALFGIARVDYWESRFGEAEQHLKDLLDAVPGHAKAWLLKSQIHRIRQENTEYATCVRKAVASDPLDDAARASLAIVMMREEKKPAAGYTESRLALQLNPYCYQAHGSMGNGWSAREYPGTQIELVGKEKQDLLEAMQTGDRMLTTQNLVKADEAFDLARKLMPNYIPALIGKGAVQYHNKNYDTALEWFFGALKLDPDYGLAHYGVSLCLLRKKDRVNVRLPEIERSFVARDVPEPAALRDVFTGYSALDTDLQKIIRISVQPLRTYLPLLKEKQVTFNIFPLHHFLWQVPGHEKLKGRRTFDGRLWDDVKGDGGSNASSGAEWERDVKYLRFNVLTHEFTHQVHGFLPKDLKDEIHRLYFEAMKTGKPLDYYAAANEMEYFAQGVEAYVSQDKLADQKITSGHTRKELQQRDPDLYAFIQKLDGI